MSCGTTGYNSLVAPSHANMRSRRTGSEIVPQNVQPNASNSSYGRSFSS